MSFLKPDRYFSRVSAIDVKRDIVAAGFRCVLLDIDNTIRSRADGQVPRDVRTWLVKLKNEGVQACLLSNNWHGNVFDLSRELDLPIVAKACKPLPHGYLIAANKLKCKRSEMVMVGDQLSTDVVGAHAVGMTAYLVCPLVEEDLKHTVFVRNIERIFIQDQEPEGAPAATVGNACEELRS